MISWGTKYDFVGEFYAVQEEVCKICSEKSQPIYIVEQAYFKLYGLSLFPTNKLYYKKCGSCKSKLKVKATDFNLPMVKNALPGKLKFKYIWGWMVLIPILSLVYYLYTIVSKS